MSGPSLFRILSNAQYLIHFVVGHRINQSSCSNVLDDVSIALMRMDGNSQLGDIL